MVKNRLSKWFVTGAAVLMAFPAFAGVKTLEPVSVDPADGEKLEADCSITITWNQSVKVTAADAVVLVNSNSQTFTGNTVLGSDNTTTVTSFTELPDGNYTLMNSYTGGFIVPRDAVESEYDAQKAVFNYTYTVGDGDEYTYSSVKLTRVFPDTYPSIEGVAEISSNDQEVLLYFDGAVEVEARTAYLPAGSDADPIPVKSVRALNEEKTEWAVALPETFLDGCKGEFKLYVYVKDTEGVQLAGNIDGSLGADQYYSFTYACYLGGVKYDVTSLTAPNEGAETYPSLDKFEIQFASNVSVNKELLAQGLITDKGGFLSSKIDAEKVEVTDNKVVFSLLNSMVYDATYNLTIPGGAFYGDDFVSAPYSGIFAVEQVNKTYDEIIPKVTPEEGEVESLKTLVLSFADYEEVGCGGGKATMTIDGGEAVELPDAVLDFNDITVAEQPLTADGSELKEPGKYVITFPTGYFCAGENALQEVDEFTLTYTITDNGVEFVGVNVDKAYDVYNTLGVKVLTNADADAVNALPAGLYIVNGKKVYVGK